MPSLSTETVEGMDVSLETGAGVGDGYVWAVSNSSSGGSSVNNRVAGATYRVQVQVSHELTGDWELQLWDRDNSGVMQLLNRVSVSGGSVNTVEGIPLSGNDVVGALTYVGSAGRRVMAKVGIDELAASAVLSPQP